MVMSVPALVIVLVVAGSQCELGLASSRTSRPVVSTIRVGNGGRWGDWYRAEYCPEGTYASIFSLKVESQQGSRDDDTALNGIRLTCRTWEGDFGTTISSHSGGWGSYTDTVQCPSSHNKPGMLTKFALKVEAPIDGDDTAANNIRFECSTETGGNRQILEGAGGKWGTWGPWSSRCPIGSAICGISTKVEPWQGNDGDDTALNDVEFYCCDH